MSLTIATSRISGKGLIYPKTLPTAERYTPLFSVPYPLIALPDDKHLDTACSWCLLWKPEEKDAGTDPSDSPLELKRCTGCKVVRYCSKTCQSRAWKSHHKLECPRYASLYPNILPASVRACVRLLLLQKKMKKESWDGILSLESHVEDFLAQGGEKGKMMPIMAKGAAAYSGTDLSDKEVLGVYCRILVNTFTITPPTSSEEIGLAFDPALARINHGCTPNAHIYVNGAEATVLAEKDVHPGDEVTICYVDPELPVEQRRQELKERWFFDCLCERCETELKGKKWKGKAKATEEETGRWRKETERYTGPGRVIGEIE